MRLHFAEVLLLAMGAAVTEALSIICTREGGSLSEQSNSGKSVPKLATTSLQLVVRFASRSPKGSSVSYGDTMVTYDALTVYADSTRINKHKHQLVLDGRVIVEDGKDQMLAGGAKLSFIRGIPKLKLVE